MKKKLMKRNGSRVSSGIILLVLLMLLVSMSNVQAQANNLPTSEYPTRGEWKKMNPSTFPGTTSSALEQCNRAARADSTGRLTAEKCKQFESMLRVGFCEIVTVPDGIVHDFMNQRVGGQSTLLPNVVKRIGRTDRAQLCDLGDGVFAYWYTGENTSCNNVGITLARSRVPAPVSVPELVVVPVTVPEVQPPQVTCRKITTGSVISGQAYFVPGMLVKTACGGSVWLNGSNYQSPPEQNTAVHILCE